MGPGIRAWPYARLDGVNYAQRGSELLVKSCRIPRRAIAEKARFARWSSTLYHCA